MALLCHYYYYYLYEYYCCRKTAVCNGDQLLDFSVPELVWSQSTFSTDPEVLQNCAGFTLCSSVDLAVGECSVYCLTEIFRIQTCLGKFVLNINSWKTLLKM